MDGLIWIARVLTAAVFGLAFVATAAAVALIGWLYRRDRNELRPWEQDLYTEELNK